MAEIMFNGDGALQDAIAIGATVHVREIDGVPVAILPGPDGWEARVVDVDAHRLTPRRGEASLTVPEVEAFTAYLTRFQEPGTIVFANVEHRTMLGEIDYHEPPGGRFGWRKHRITLHRPHLPAFSKWLAANGKWLTQEQFADFLEVRIAEIVEPDGAVLFELAEHFSATRSLSFASQKRLSDGNVQLHWVEQTEGRGPSGDVTVPTRFTLRLQPYEDSGTVDVEARLRWRLADGKVTFMLLVGEELEEWLRGEFRERMAEVGAATGLPVIAVRG